MSDRSTVETLPPQLPESDLPQTKNVIDQPEETTQEAEPAPPWFKDALQKISDAWFDPKSFESPDAYEKIGIRKFKRYMPLVSSDIFQRKVWKRIGGKSFINGKSDLKKSTVYTKVAEASHSAIFLAMSAGIAQRLENGDIRGAAFMAGINTLANVYPVMMHRYNRIRLYRAINKMEELDSVHSQKTQTNQNPQTIKLDPSPS